MKKRLIALTVTLCLLLGLVPGTASAAMVEQGTPHCTLATAQDLPLNTEVQGDFTVANANLNNADYYRLRVPSHGTLKITYNSEAGLYRIVNLQDDQDKPIHNFGVNPNTVPPFSPGSVRLPPGTYYLKITGNGDESTKYTLRADFTAAHTSVYEQEYNDSFQSANPLTLGRTMRGETDVAEQSHGGRKSDYFVFSIPRRQVVTMLYEQAGQGESNNALVLYNSAQAQMVRYDLKETNRTFPFQYTIELDAGTYYLRVWAVATRYDNSDYALTVSAADAQPDRESEDNSTFAQADPLIFGQPMSGDLRDSYEGRHDDCFKVTLPQGKKVVLTYNATITPSGHYFRLYDAKGTYLLNHLMDRKITYPYTSPVLELAAGDYYLCVEAYSSSVTLYDSEYTISIKDAPAEPTPTPKPTATPTPTPKPTATPSPTPSVKPTPTPTASPTPTPKPTPTPAPSPTPAPTPPPGLSTNPTDPAAAEGASSWAKADVARAITLGFVPGELQGNYQQNITRQEFCKLIVQMLMAKSSTLSSQEAFVKAFAIDLSQNPFGDTSDQYVKIAYALQIVNGTGSGNFTPNGSITRQEAATMLRRAAAVFQFTEAGGSPTAFTDKGAVAAWASAGVDFVSAIGVMGGTGGGYFSPHGSYSREQSIVTALRLFDAFPRSSYAV